MTYPPFIAEYGLIIPQLFPDCKGTFNRKAAHTGL